MRTYIIDGNKFSNIEGFFDEIDLIMTKGTSFKTGHNLNAFRDILYGGFGCHEPGEPFVIKWLNYQKSRKELGDTIMLAIIDIIADPILRKRRNSRIGLTRAGYIIYENN